MWRCTCYFFCTRVWVQNVPLACFSNQSLNGWLNRETADAVLKWWGSVSAQACLSFVTLSTHTQINTHTHMASALSLLWKKMFFRVKISQLFHCTVTSWILHGHDCIKRTHSVDSLSGKELCLQRLRIIKTNGVNSTEVCAIYRVTYQILLTRVALQFASLNWL